MGITIKQPRVIICEGEADKAFFTHLISERNLPAFDVFHPSEMQNVASGNTGFCDFLRGLSVLLPSASVSGVLVVSDNDLNPDKSFEDIRNQIEEAGGFGVPGTPMEVARSQTYPPLVVMMLPRVGVPGALETLCLEAIYQARPDLKNCLDDYCTCAGVSAWDIVKQSKMRLETLVPSICKSDPATSLRYAWSRTESIVPLGSNAFNGIADVLRVFDNIVQL